MMRAPANSIWPALPLEQWEDTFATLHMWSQIVGKTRLAPTPMMKHWRNATLYAAPPGRTTGPTSSGRRPFAGELDLLRHALTPSLEAGSTRTPRLARREAGAFY